MKALEEKNVTYMNETMNLQEVLNLKELRQGILEVFGLNCSEISAWQLGN